TQTPDTWSAAADSSYVGSVTYTRQMHHCRACGQVFCAQCSSKTSTVPKFGFEKEVRVCEACYDSINKPTTTPGPTTATAVKGEGDLPPEYVSSSLAQQNQRLLLSERSQSCQEFMKKLFHKSEAQEENVSPAPPRKTEEELREEEEFQLALALSQSEAEHKEKEVSGRVLGQNRSNRNPGGVALYQGRQHLENTSGCLLNSSGSRSGSPTSGKHFRLSFK
ncbi:unnamed protein product, partial [Timema podura]|nr:unnamed protein product [Timema podura]